MKRRLSCILLSLTIILTGMVIPPKAVQADNTFTYTLGRLVSGEIVRTSSGFFGWGTTYSTDTYTFNLDRASDVIIEFTGTPDWELYYGGSFVKQSYDWENKDAYYLKAGSYSFKVTDYAGTYSFKIYKSNQYVLKFASASGKIGSASSVGSGDVDGELKKEVSFTYSCSPEYAKANITMKNSKPKVADCELTVNEDGTGLITLDPKKVGTTKVTLRITGGKSVTYTGTVNSMYVFMAKGSGKTLPKPVGVKKIKWKSKKKKIVTVDKKGKITAKNGGRGRVTAKSGKKSFTYNIVVTDYIKLGKQVYRQLKDQARNPERFKIYNVYRGYDKNIVPNVKIPVVYVDFGTTNSNGAMERGKIIACYDDVHEIKVKFVNTYTDVMNRKRIKASLIK